MNENTSFFTAVNFGLPTIEVHVLLKDGDEFQSSHVYFSPAEAREFVADALQDQGLTMNDVSSIDFRYSVSVNVYEAK